MPTQDTNARPEPDQVLVDIAAYVADGSIASAEASTVARYCLLDALGCAVLALRSPECVKLLGPLVSGTFVPTGARVPGTQFELDPVQAAFDLGSMIRWLDFNDAWLAADTHHPSDNLGGLLAVADYLSRVRVARGSAPLRMRDVLSALIKAYEIQGVLALENSLTRVGLDHVLFLKVASTAAVTALLGGGREEIVNAVSNAWIDNSSLRTYRHAPNTGWRKGWAAGDATSRAVRLAWLSMRGEMGYPWALTAPTWGFYDVMRDGQPFVLGRPYGSYVIEDILFKVCFPTEFHAQTAVECAVKLHGAVVNRLDEVEKIVLTTQEAAMRVINKTGPLYTPADRDHCLQNSRDYPDAAKRSDANAVQVFFTDGTATEKVAVEYPIGHPHRRREALPLLEHKFARNLRTRFPERQVRLIQELCSDQQRLEASAVQDFVGLFVI